MPFQRDALVVLAAWREAERELERAAPGSPEEESLNADIERMRTEYRRLIELAREAHRPEPPPLDDQGRPVFGD
jgi:hypothetical protein